MNKRLLLIVFGILWFLPGKAQDAVDSMRIYYVVGHREVDPSFRDNGAELDRFLRAVRVAVREETIERITICSSASPDGYNKANERLAMRRADSLAAYIARHGSVPEVLIEKHAIGIAWDMLRRQVAASDMEYRDEVLDILDNTPVFVFDERDRVVDGRKKRLMDLRGGRPYKYMLEGVFPDLRSSVCATLYIKPSAGVADTTVVVPLPESEPIFGPEAEPVAEIVSKPVTEMGPVPEWRPMLSVKTNAVGLGMLLLNAAVEIDLSQRLSLNLPVYYSACDYFTDDVKFRMLGFQPELRVWPLAERKFFVGLHFGVAYYNFAFGGPWRIQDHDGSTPAWGGGVNVGYRLPLSCDKRWNVEFSLGAGVYDVHYDKFHNGYNGAYASSVKKTFFGIDSFAVSFSYMFDIKNKRK